MDLTGGRAAKPQPLFCQYELPVDPPIHFAAVCHGKMDRNAAEKLLDGEHVGTYLVRESTSSPGDFSLSLRLSSSVKHWKIYYSPEGKYHVGGTGFNSLDGLVQNGLATLEPQQIRAPKPNHTPPSLELLTHQQTAGAVPERSYRKQAPLVPEEPIYDHAMNCGPVPPPELPSRTQRLTLDDPPAPTALGEAPLLTRRVASKREVKPHNFQQRSGAQPTKCDICRSIMLAKVAIKCADCGLNVHLDCARSAEECQPQKKLLKRVFGSDLVAYCKAHEVSLPHIVTACINEVEARGMTEEGIYRVSGNKVEIEALKKLFNKEPEMAVIPPTMDIHAVSGVLKQYLRELPVPLVPFDLYRSMVNGTQISDERYRSKLMRQDLFAMPDNHFRALKAIVGHLRRVEQLKMKNKMTSTNLGMVFGPTLMREQVDDPLKAVSESNYLIQVVESFLSHYTFLFQTDTPQ